MEHMITIVLVVLASFFGTTLAMAMREEKINLEPLNPVAPIVRKVKEKKAAAQAEEQNTNAVDWLYDNKPPEEDEL